MRLLKGEQDLLDSSLKFYIRGSRYPLGLETKTVKKEPLDAMFYRFVIPTVM